MHVLFLYSSSATIRWRPPRQGFAWIVTEPTCDNARNAERVLPPAFKELIRATKEPFVQAIMDLACPQLVFNHHPDGRCFFRDPATYGGKHLEGHCERLRACGRTGRKAGIIRIARSLAAVGVESRPATDELRARSRQVAKALVNENERAIQRDLRTTPRVVLDFDSCLTVLILVYSNRQVLLRTKISLRGLNGAVSK
jgi:hypothetical protein